MFTTKTIIIELRKTYLGAYLVYRSSGNTIQPIYWCARKLKRVESNNGTAELLAASDAIYMLHHVI